MGQSERGCGAERDGGGSAGSQEHSFIPTGADHWGGMKVRGCPPFWPLVEEEVEGE